MVGTGVDPVTSRFSGRIWANLAGEQRGVGTARKTLSVPALSWILAGHPMYGLSLEDRYQLSSIAVHMASTLRWEEIEDLVNDLAKGCSQAMDNIDAIVGIARGGWIPARLLAKELDISQLYSLGLKYEAPDRTSLSGYQLADLVNSNVVVVEDATESGRALDHARELLEAQGNKVLTSALLARIDSEVLPMVFCRMVPDLLQFPWER